MGWFANIFIIVGLWMAGNKAKWAFLFTIIGESIWCIYSIHLKMYDLAFVCGVFALIAVRNLIKWTKNIAPKK